jgi:hypothetical protein
VGVCGNMKYSYADICLFYVYIWFDVPLEKKSLLKITHTFCYAVALKI